MNNMMSRYPEFSVSLLGSLVAIGWSGMANGKEYQFDPSLFQGSPYDVNLVQFEGENIIPGHYRVDVYVNNTLVVNGSDVEFRSVSPDNTVQPCLTRELMMAAQLKSLAGEKRDDEGECRPLQAWSAGGSWQFDQSTLRLQLSIPSTELLRTTRGYIPPSEWDEGMPALFLRHNTSYTTTENTDSHYRYQYLWSGINSGFNYGLWQLRHQGNLRYVDSNTGNRAYHYNAVRTWIQRPIEALNSIVSLGDGYTDSSLFGSLSFNGLKLATDERMRPQGKRGYAPEIRGVASSSARVVVKQLGKVIYETHVAPGPFLIDDLYNTRNQGDIDVDVIEANGKTSTFTVPYSSVPDSVRPGNWHYAFAAGKVRDYYSVDNDFIEGVVQQGVSNQLTVNLGTRQAKDYQAWLAGGVWATWLGAMGVNATWSTARVLNNQREQGWRAETSYSKTFSSGTNLVLAAYRYSTEGFRDLQDVLGVRRQAKNGITYYSDTLQQRNRLSAAVSQTMGDWGMVNINASTADYYNNRSRVTQIQAGYSNQWRRISYGINIARQRTTWDYGRFYNNVRDMPSDSRQQKYTETTLSLNFSLPLDWGRSMSTVAYNYNQSKQSRSSTVSVTGSSGEYRDLTWSAYGGYEQYRQDGNGNTTTWGGNVQKNTRIGALRASYDQGENYRQAGLGASGTLVVHPGGVTLGPWTSETFALIHAEGAQGAIVQNGQGAVIDSFGYAILPALSPYRNNNVSLETRQMSRDAELTGGSQRVVPYAGAIARVKFHTLKGKAVLINLSSSQGMIPPMGAEVRTAEGTVIGMVGQGGQIYARVPNVSGVLRVLWGESTRQTCVVRYQITGKNDTDLIHLNQTCDME